MTKLPISAIALSLTLFAAACDELPVTTGSAVGDVTRLQSQGYRVTGRSQDGTVTVMKYKGAINGSVQCAQGSGPYGTVRPRNVTSNGAVQEFQLNTYLVLTSGTTTRRDGLYVISRSTRPSAGAAVNRIESIAFEPGKRGTFPSGLTCQAR